MTGRGPHNWTQKIRAVVMEPYPRAWRDRWYVRYGSAVALVMLGTLVRFELGAFGVTAPYLTYYPAVVLSGLLFGFGPGVLATVLSGFATDSCLIPPPHLFDAATLGDAIGHLFFITAGFCLSLAAGWTRWTARQLSESARVLYHTQRVAGVGSWVWAVETGTVTWSEELFHIAGRDPDVPAPAIKEHRLLYSPESWASLGHALEESFESAESRELELEMLRPDGTRRWVVARGVPEQDRDGSVTHIRGTVLDITRRKQAEEERARIEERRHLAQRLESTGRLAGGIAHHFNNC